MSFRLADHVRSKEHQNLSGKLRPSGRFSVVQLFPKKKKRLVTDEEKIKAPQGLRSVQELDDAYGKLSGGDFSPLREMSPSDRAERGEVGLSDEPISPNRNRRGSKGINSRQRDILCWGASTLERIYHRTNLSFLTYTLPPLSPEDLLSVKENWSDIVHRVQLRIKEKLHAKGIQTSIAGCIELQLDRFETTGDVYPHLHLVFRGRKDRASDWAIKPHQYRQIWRKCVSKFLLSQEYDWRASENVQPVHKSVAGYLAKYVSKCASKAEPGLLADWHPRDWIFLSRKIRRLYETMSYSGYALALQLDQIVRGWRAGNGYVNRVSISSPGFGERFIGFVGWLKGEERYPSYQEVHSCN